MSVKKSKKSVQESVCQSVGDSLGSLIGYYSEQLRWYIDGSALMEVCRLRTRAMRLNEYHSILRDACRQCFRSTGVVVRGSSYSCDVWGFNGRLWERLSPVVFSDAVGSALIGAADVYDAIVTEDWVSKRSQMLNDAYSGLCDETALLSVSPSVVGFSNGVWDFSDIDNPVEIPFSERPCVTELLPYAYDPDATCPLWTSFIGMMLPQKDVVRLQKYLGLGVVNRRHIGHSIEDTLWLVGSGANGKSTIAKVLSAVYGADNVSWLSMRELLDRNPITRMMSMSRIDGCLFNICEEADMGDITRDSESFKKLCSGSPQSGRDIGRNVREVRDIPFLVFMMNKRPSNRRMDGAFRRRLVTIDFKVTVKEEDMDTNLYEKLLGELPGIRNWMMEGYRLLMSDGFQFSHTQNEEYMEENGQYFDIFVKHEGLRPSAWAGHDEKPQYVKADLLLREFDDFVMRKHLSSEHPTSKSMWSDLMRLGFRSQRKTKGVYYEVYCERVLDYGGI